MVREVWLLSKCWGEEKLSMRERGEIGERGLKGENMMEWKNHGWTFYSYFSSQVWHWPLVCTDFVCLFVKFVGRCPLMRIEQVLKKSVVDCLVEIVLINNPKIIIQKNKKLEITKMPDICFYRFVSSAAGILHNF